MTYDEQIIEESKKRYALQTERDAFLDGVQYCEDNPAWRMCEEELPDKSDDYIVAYEDGSVFTEYFIASRKEWKHLIEESDRWVNPRAKVVAWLPLPKHNLKSK